MIVRLFALRHKYFTLFLLKKFNFIFHVLLTQKIYLRKNH